MIQSPVMVGFAHDEWVVYVATPSVGMKGYWLRITVAALVGLALFILPGIIVFVVGLIAGLAARSRLQERYGSAQCVVTSRRIIVAEWGRRRSLVEFEHGRIARVTSSGLLSRLLVGASARIHGVDGRRVTLDRLPDADDLVEAVQHALASNRY